MSSCSKSPSVIYQRLGQLVANGEKNALLGAKGKEGTGERREKESEKRN